MPGRHESDEYAGGHRRSHGEQQDTHVNVHDDLKAFRYGMPPHGGLGAGLERLTARLLGLANIREATLFPRDRKRLERYIAVIADMVRSRDVPTARRRLLQKRFTELIASLNREYRKAIAARFVITLGDEFQGLLNSAALIPDLVWRLEHGHVFPVRYHSTRNWRAKSRQVCSLAFTNL